MAFVEVGSVVEEGEIKMVFELWPSREGSRAFGPTAPQARFVLSKDDALDLYHRMATDCARWPCVGGSHDLIRSLGDVGECRVCKRRVVWLQADAACVTRLQTTIGVSLLVLSDRGVQVGDLALVYSPGGSSTLRDVVAVDRAALGVRSQFCVHALADEDGCVP